MRTSVPKISQAQRRREDNLRDGGAHVRAGEIMVQRVFAIYLVLRHGEDIRFARARVEHVGHGTEWGLI